MPKRARAILTTLAVAAALLVATASPASANYIWQLRDGFEGDTSPWYSSGSSNNGDAGVWTGVPDRAHSGNNLGNIAVFDDGARFWSYGRPVTLPAGRMSCGAQIYVSPEWFGEVRVLHVNVEVFRPSTWTYLAVNRVDLPDQGGANTYVAIATPTWTSGPDTVFFRVSLLGRDLGPFTGMINIDDLQVRCTVAGTIPVG